MAKTRVFGLHWDREWQIHTYLVFPRKRSGKYTRIWSSLGKRVVNTRVFGHP